MTSPLPAPSARSATDRLPVGVLLLLAGVVFAAVSTEVLPVGLLPQLARDFGVDQARIGGWVSAYAVVVAAGALPMTSLVARWPQREVLVVLVLAYAASNVAVTLTDDYWFAVVARLLSGLAHAAVFSVVVAVAVAVAPPRRVGRAVALVNSGVALALTLGVPLGTAMGTAWGWRWGFVAMAAALVVLACAVAVVLPAAGPGRSRSGQEAGAQRPSVLAELRRPALLLVAAVTVVLMVGHYASYTYISPLSLDAGIPLPLISIVLLGYGAASIVGLALAGACADHHPVAALRVTIGLVAGCLLAAAPASGSAVATALVITAWGAAFGALPSLLQLAALRATAVPDAAPAVVNATFNTGIAVGAWLGGVLLVPGEYLLTTTSGVLATAALALTLALGRSPRPDG